MAGLDSRPAPVDSPSVMPAFRLVLLSLLVVADLAAAVDARMNYVAAPGTSWFAGDRLLMGFSLRNEGSDPAAAFTVRIYASPDTAISPGDRELFSFTGGPLAAGATFVDAPFVTLPWDLPGGVYFIGAIVTAVGDLTPANDTAHDADPIQVREPSNLRAVSLAAPNYALYPGGGFSVALSVRNNGPGDCPGFTARFVASRDTLITTDDPVIGGHAYGPLAPGEQVGGAILVPIVMPADITPDVSYYIGAIVEYDHDPNPGDNSTFDDDLVFVESRPDLAVIEVTVPDGPFAAGEGIGVTLALRNEGTADCPAYTATIHASEDDLITAEDPILGTVTGDPVAKGLEDRQLAVVPIPPGLPPGAYTIGVIVDCPGDGVYPNNVGRDDTPVDVTVVSDLRAVELRVTSDDPFLTPGSFISTFHVTANDGPSDSRAYGIDFYLSTDAIITAEDRRILHTDPEPLPVGGEGRYSTGLRVPEDLPPGEWFVGMIATADEDPDDGNNRAVFAAPVRIAPPPTDRARILSIRPIAGARLRLRWVAPAGRSYRLTRSANLADGFPEILAEGLGSDGTLETSVVGVGPGTRGFFRLEEE